MCINNTQYDYKNLKMCYIDLYDIKLCDSHRHCYDKYNYEYKIIKSNEITIYFLDLLKLYYRWFYCYICNCNKKFTTNSYLIYEK